jgi:hypothetical protein
MLATVIGFGVLGAILNNRRNEFPTIKEDGVLDEKQSVLSVFEGPHEMYPRGAYDLKIDGAGFSTIFAQGNPEPRNPLNNLILDESLKKAGSLINKNNRNWESVGLLNKSKQLKMIEEKISKDDYFLLWPQFKQLSGCTVSSQPKINLKYAH